MGPRSASIVDGKSTYTLACDERAGGVLGPYRRCSWVGSWGSGGRTWVTEKKVFCSGARRISSPAPSRRLPPPLARRRRLIEEVGKGAAGVRVG